MLHNGSYRFILIHSHQNSVQGNVLHPASGKTEDQVEAHTNKGVGPPPPHGRGEGVVPRELDARDEPLAGLRSASKGGRLGARDEG